MFLLRSPVAICAITRKIRAAPSMTNSHPLIQLVLARLREFYREPEAVFWVFVFPLLMTVGLGVAFRNRPVEKIAVDVQEGNRAAHVVEGLARDKKFDIQIHDPATCKVRL